MSKKKKKNKFGEGVFIFRNLHKKSSQECFPRRVSVSLGHLPATPYMQSLPPKPFLLEGPSRHLFHTLPGKKVNIFQ